ncbi:hypothetical protein F25303_10060 [Fusarium sp. NRRL 25303]|nr:hypothetical protein F25303_10060 [Fusarium sp. NRRL 25303]
MMAPPTSEYKATQVSSFLKHTHIKAQFVLFSCFTHTHTAITLITFQSQDARVLRTRAEKLEEWWRNDTKSAARHDIDGRNLFQQTCQEAEAAEPKTTEDGAPK